MLRCGVGEEERGVDDVLVLRRVVVRENAQVHSVFVCAGACMCMCILSYYRMRK